MKRNLKQRASNYKKYKMTKNEYILFSLEGALLICLMGYFFYRSLLITVLCMPLIIVFLKIKEGELCEKRKNQLQIQFKDILVSVNTSVRAGYSLENAFRESYKDIVMFYGEDSIAADELRTIIRGLNNNVNITNLISDLGERSHVSDIRDFAGILVIGKKSGGKLPEILDSYIRVAEERVSVLEEIETIISSQKYEQRIMNCVPFFIIFYVESTSAGFFDCLYNGIAGRIIMTICLLLYISSVYAASKISNISV